MDRAATCRLDTIWSAMRTTERTLLCRMWIPVRPMSAGWAGTMADGVPGQLRAVILMVRLALCSSNTLADALFDRNSCHRDHWSAAERLWIHWCRTRRHSGALPSAFSSLTLFLAAPADSQTLQIFGCGGFVGEDIVRLLSGACQRSCTLLRITDSRWAHARSRGQLQRLDPLPRRFRWMGQGYACVHPYRPD